ncbi:DUF4421 family protein [Rhizosphaericola mali]|uniref:DUF4421 domain-containing protein n=1 Tax=Rhizosphaericola mali TaxID=2545455 RepID=A0A5P2G245_9BACT|nr:DUF4421 family protein [Rhizosphaericola mali]QES89247.1 DUF4421 domain-containing protein [Rhizosphaericola mali]
MKLNFWKTFLIFFLVLLLFQFKGLAQKYNHNLPKDSLVDGADPRYILDYGKKIVGRIYIQKKVNSFSAKNSGYEDLKYVPNNVHGIGLGASYRWISLSLSVAKLGSEDPNRGKSHIFDLQSNIYKRKMVYDFMIRNIKGFYLNNEGQVPGTNGYYVNPDMHTFMIGGAAWRILNDQKFSYRAVMTQSEWQRKSAGSILIGWELYYGNMNANGNVVPITLSAEHDYPQKNVTKINYFKTGPGIGYAYNYVLWQNFFLSGGLTGNMDVGFTNEHRTDGKDSKLSFMPNVNFRIGAGYNTRDWNINFNYLRNNLPINGALNDSKYNQFAGSYRLSFNRRFSIGHKTRKALRPIDQRINKIDDFVNGKDKKGNQDKK